MSILYKDGFEMLYRLHWMSKSLVNQQNRYLGNSHMMSDPCLQKPEASKED